MSLQLFLCSSSAPVYTRRGFAEAAFVSYSPVWLFVLLHARLLLSGPATSVRERIFHFLMEDCTCFRPSHSQRGMRTNSVRCQRPCASVIASRYPNKQGSKRPCLELRLSLAGFSSSLSGFLTVLNLRIASRTHRARALRRGNLSALSARITQFARGTLRNPSSLSLPSRRVFSGKGSRNAKGGWRKPGRSVQRDASPGPRYRCARSRRPALAITDDTACIPVAESWEHV